MSKRRMAKAAIPDAPQPALPGVVVPAEAWYLATVWMGPDEYAVGKPVVIRLQATSADDYRARIREFNGATFLAFGPVSRSRVQR